MGHPDARRGGSPVEAVLLDAYGTLVELRDPEARLRDRLAAEGHRHPAERVEAALAGEIRFYRRHHDRGRDAASLAALRLDCARALAEGLGPDVPPLARLADILVESLRFELLPDALPALDDLAAAGLRLAVVSNWDAEPGRCPGRPGGGRALRGGGRERRRGCWQARPRDLRPRAVPPWGDARARDPLRGPPGIRLRGCPRGRRAGDFDRPLGRASGRALSARPLTR